MAAEAASGTRAVTFCRESEMAILTHLSLYALHCWRREAWHWNEAGCFHCVQVGIVVAGVGGGMIGLSVWWPQCRFTAICNIRGMYEHMASHLFNMLNCDS